MNAILLLDKNVLPNIRDDLYKLSRQGHRHGRLDKINIIEFCETAMTRIMKHAAAGSAENNNQTSQQKKKHNLAMLMDYSIETDGSITSSIAKGGSIFNSSQTRNNTVAFPQLSNNSEKSSMLRSLCEVFDQVR